MALPRLRVPGATYLVTRTVTQRLFLLTPSPVVHQLFASCLARAPLEFGVLVHAVCVESTHRTDVSAMFPAGTLRWTRLLGAACHEIDTPWCAAPLHT